LKITENIKYSSIESDALVLDLFEPDADPGGGGGGKAKKPGAVIIHGGGWMNGDKTKPKFVDMAKFMAELGLVAVNINYRLGGEAPAPAALEDCKCAIRWLRVHAETLGVDTHKIVAIGGSAGGHLALMTGLCHDPEFERGDWLDQSSRVSAVIAQYPPTDVRDLLVGSRARPFTNQWLPETMPDRLAQADKLSPIHYVDGQSVPVLIIHGDADALVPYSHSVQLIEKLKQAGRDARLLTVPGGVHGRWPEDSVDYEQWFRDEQIQLLHRLGFIAR
jgi:acetyl esterase/lipase